MTPASSIDLDLAYCLSKAGRSEEAVETLNALIAQYDVRTHASDQDRKTAAYAHRIRGAIAGARGHEEEAVRDNQQAIDLFSQIPGSDLALAVCWLNQGIFLYNTDRLQSRSAFDQAEKLIANSGHSKDELASLTEIIDEHKALFLDQDGKISEALALAEATVQRLQGDFKRAPDNVDSERDLAHGLNSLGTMFVNAGDLPKALDAFDSAVAHYSNLVDVKAQHDAVPEYIGALCNRSETRRKAGQFRAAVQDGDTAVQISRLFNALSEKHGNPTGRRWLALSLERLGTILSLASEYDEALLRLNESISLYDDLTKGGSRALLLEEAEAKNELGLLFAHQGRKKDAIAQFRDLRTICDAEEARHISLQWESFRITALTNFAESSFVYGAEADAKAIFEAILDTPANRFSGAPSIVEMLARTKGHLALVLSQSKTFADPGRALQLSSEAVHDSHSWQVHYCLAVAQAENGHFDKAIDEDRGVLTTCPIELKPFVEAMIAGFRKGKSLRQQKAEATGKSDIGQLQLFP